MTPRSHSDRQNVVLSVVIPAYNEAARLPPYLETIRDHLTDEYGGDYEVVVVVDGGQDDLRERLAERRACWPQLRVLRHDTNRGKGAAVRTGMLAATGSLLLFADADGATPIQEERKLRTRIEAGADIAVGSRLVPAAHVHRSRNLLRQFMSQVFLFAVRRACHVPVEDTQCGFKMFRGVVGRRLFAAATEDGYLFDLQILMLAAKWGHEVTEVPVAWRDVPGSKVRRGRDSWKMWRGLQRLKPEVDRIVLSEAVEFATQQQVTGASLPCSPARLSGR